MQGFKIIQRSSGKGKELSFAYTHCSHSDLQVFSPSWCGAADPQTEHLLNYTGMCVLDVYMFRLLSPFSRPLSQPFFLSHSQLYYSQDLKFKTVLGRV